jgi:hypothetical protein
MHAVAALPTAPGAYATTVTVTDRRFGRVVARTAPLTVFIPGSRRATIRIHATGQGSVTGSTVEVGVSVANSGTETWAEPPPPQGAPTQAVAPRDTRLVAQWIPIDVFSDEASFTSADPVPDDPDPVTIEVPQPVVLEALPLEPGAVAHVAASLDAPDAPGTWALILDVRDDLDGSYAVLGSAPAVQLFEIVPERGIVAIH